MSETQAREPEKCGAVKRGGVDLHCSLPPGHDIPQDGHPAEWHHAVFTERREISYDGARHLIEMTETVDWEPVDRIAEAMRHIAAGQNRSTT